MKKELASNMAFERDEACAITVKNPRPGLLIGAADVFAIGGRRGGF